MLWLMVFIGIIVVVGGILGGMGFFGPSDAPDYRDSGGSRFIDWIL